MKRYGEDREVKRFTKTNEKDIEGEEEKKDNRSQMGDEEERGNG